MAQTLSNSVRVGLLYQDGTTRSYTFGGVSATDLTGIPDRIKAINAAPSSAFFSTFVSNTGSDVLRIATGTVISELQEVIYEG